MTEQRDISGSKKIQHSQPGFGARPSTGPSVSGAPAAQPATGTSHPPMPTPTPRAETAAVPRTNDTLPVAEAQGLTTGGSKIRTLGQMKRHEDEWNRTPNVTGQGAIHVRTFHAKLTEDALRYMDQTINEWLDAHPQYEVKFVNAAVGTLTGKLKEPALICQVWV